jgi:hypothetical protein
MLKVDCSELSGATKLALASAISEELRGSAVALLTGHDVVIDALSGRPVTAARLRSAVESFFNRRNDSSNYRTETRGDSIVVHSSERLTEEEKRVPTRLPPGFIQCPVCGFVTTLEGKYKTHLRMHDMMRGIAR